MTKVRSAKYNAKVNIRGKIKVTWEIPADVYRIIVRRAKQDMRSLQDEVAVIVREAEPPHQAASGSHAVASVARPDTQLEP